jgi:multidrug efflux pump
MIGVTMFGIFLTPVFYVVLRALTGNRHLKQHGQAKSSASAIEERPTDANAI